MRLPIELEGCNDDPWLCKCETQLAYHHSVLVRYYVCVVRSGGVFIFYFPSVLKEGTDCRFGSLRSHMLLIPPPINFQSYGSISHSIHHVV